MQKLSLNQSLQQKLSPQQIQFIKLLQVPTAELESRIEEELEINPALEEGEQNESEPAEQEQEQEPIDNESDSDVEKPEEPESTSSDEDIDIKDYLRDRDY